jgi:catechol 2,3-dioxygenase-like lactoylglutathione lyase family enzyme
MIKGIKFVTIPVTDQDRALAFYTEQLGFVVATDQPFDEHQRWIELRIPGADTRVVLFVMEGEPARIGGAQPITFVADDVERTYRELSARGITFTAPPSRYDWGSGAVFSDPDGNKFLISSK